MVFGYRHLNHPSPFYALLVAEDFFHLSLHLCGLREVLVRRWTLRKALDLVIPNYDPLNPQSSLNPKPLNP